MFDLLIFGGTTEGRELADFCDKHQVEAYVSVVSEYGSVILPEYESIKVIQGAKDVEEIADFIRRNGIKRVIDATHPFAKQASENIRKACQTCDITPVRCLRKNRDLVCDGTEQFAYVKSIDEAIEYIKDKDGAVLAVTGSNELAKYKDIKDFEERLYVRVIPSADILKKCMDLGVPMGHICAMQGPFSREFNEEHLKSTKACFMVTKESGLAGGFTEKLEACRNLGVTCVIIEKPSEEGLTLEETFQYIAETYHFPFDSKNYDKMGKVSLVGIGPGNIDYLTGIGRRLISEADIVIGASRMLAFGKEISEVSSFTKNKEKRYIDTYKPQEIFNIIGKNRDKKIVVLYSGDTGFYSGTAGLAKLLDEGAVEYEIIPGISSFQYMASKLGVFYQDAMLMSCHGIEVDETQVTETLGSGKAVFMLTGGKDGAAKLLMDLKEAGFGARMAAVGEKLSYESERITKGTVSALACGIYDGLAVVYLFDSRQA